MNGREVAERAAVTWTAVTWSHSTSCVLLLLRDDDLHAQADMCSHNGLTESYSRLQQAAVRRLANEHYLRDKLECRPKGPHGWNWLKSGWHSYTDSERHRQQNSEPYISQHTGIVLPTPNRYRVLINPYRNWRNIPIVISTTGLC